jgi:DNA-binding NarL/FixJ family response regulator
MRVILADDSTLFRSGLAELLTAVDVQVVAEATEASELLHLVDIDPPDVVIIDIRMPPTHTDEGLVAAERIRRAHPGVGVLVLSTYAETRLAVRLLAHGSRGVGYLLKDRVTTVSALRDALLRISAGESMIDAEIVDRLLRLGRRDDVVDRLTERERDVLRAMAEGRSNAGIATALVLSERTVENYAARIFTKLGLSNEADANRRVLAVLTWLRSNGSSSASGGPVRW